MELAPTASSDRPTVVLVGASGSHPATISAIGTALAAREAPPRIVVMDMTRFDRRGTADYSRLPFEVVGPTPRDMGLWELFTTAGPNIVVSGGIARFNAMVKRFKAILQNVDAKVLLFCSFWGMAEQALLQAAAQLGLKVALIDEGPFSVPLKGTEGERFSRRAIFAFLRTTRLYPTRETSGALLDVVFSTAPGRAQELRQRGVEPSKICVVPSPRFDYLGAAAKSFESIERTCEVKRILWIHQPFRDDGKINAREVDRAENVLVEALQRLGAIRPISVRVRFHPRTSDRERERVSRLLADLSTGGDAPRADLIEDLRQTDACVGFYSSALLEACICGVPVFASELKSEAFARREEAAKARQIRQLGIPVADSATALAELINTGLSNGVSMDRDLQIERQIGSLEGNGAQQVAEHLMGLTSGVARRL